MRQEIDAISQIRWLEVSNQAGETIPAGALLRITGQDSSGRLEVGKPDSTSQGCNDLLINGPAEIASGCYGFATRDLPTMALYDTGDGTPAVGEIWGPSNGSFKLRKAWPGYRIADAGASGSVLVGPMTYALVAEVRITSTTMSGGYYPGKVQLFDAGTNTWTDGPDCWVADSNQ